MVDDPELGAAGAPQVPPPATEEPPLGRDPGVREAGAAVPA
jgi:hypothetical protein